jgi:DNA-binding response OmpR family regulator
MKDKGIERVLLIDSHPEQLKQYSAYLKEKGYEVDIARTVQQGEKLLEETGFSCVVMKDFEDFHAIRQKTDAPILFLTEKSWEQVRLRMLSRETAESGVLEFPPLRIELMNRRVFCGGEKISLSNREFDLLVFFARHPGEVVTFEQIGEELYGTYLDSDRKNVMVCASRLRKRFGDHKGLARKIETVWGRGYRFRA